MFSACVCSQREASSSCLLLVFTYLRASTSVSLQSCQSPERTAITRNHRLSFTLIYCRKMWICLTARSRLWLPVHVSSPALDAPCCLLCIAAHTFTHTHTHSHGRSEVMQSLPKHFVLFRRGMKSSLEPTLHILQTQTRSDVGLAGGGGPIRSDLDPGPGGTRSPGPTRSYKQSPDLLGCVYFTV